MLDVPSTYPIQREGQRRVPMYQYAGQLICKRGLGGKGTGIYLHDRE